MRSVNNMREKLEEIFSKLPVREIENAIFLTILVEFSLFLIYSLLKCNFSDERIIRGIEIILMFLATNFLLYIRFKRKGGNIFSIIIFIFLIIIGHFLYFSIYIPPLYIKEKIVPETKGVYTFGRIFFFPILIGILFLNFLPISPYRKK
ncbi:MAG: hypothetical protein DRO92_04070 [Candidatus Altiarchaeales archaeon]|nr:MAG: hypothetical protein DRO92_04070 [Candidatus Altiarchaeales archaeon]